jgi:hypothetical protein
MIEGVYALLPRCHSQRTRLTALPRKKLIAADVVRVGDGLLAEHWGVLQDEATEAESQSGLPMFGTKFRGSNRGRKSPIVARCIVISGMLYWVFSPVF